MKRWARGAPCERPIVTSRADQRVLHAPVEVDDLRALQHDRVLDLGVLDAAVLADRRVRADERVADRCVPLPITTGPRTWQRSSTAPASTTTRPSSAGAVATARRRCASRCDRGRAGWPRACPRPCPCPSTSRSRRAGRRAGRGRSGLDRVGDLELAARGGRDGLDRLPDAGSEEVDADQGEVGARLLRLLDQPRHAAVAVELGDAVLAAGRRRAGAGSSRRRRPPRTRRRAA